MDVGCKWPPCLPHPTLQLAPFFARLNERMLALPRTLAQTPTLTLT